MTPTMWAGVPEDSLIEDDSVLPVQFAPDCKRPMTPERRLALAVLWSALLDLQKYRFATGRRRQRLYMKAHEWVTSDDREWEFSFVRLCEEFGLDVAAARAGLLDLGRPGADLKQLEEALPDVEGETRGEINEAA